MKKFKVAIVGMGQVGYKFDLDPKRKEIWTHYGAYNFLDKTEIVAVCDKNSKELKNNPKIISNIYEDYEVMFDKEDIDILSICTPEDKHAEVINAAVEKGIKNIFCEKVLTDNLNTAEEVVNLCNKNQIRLCVNYNKRWDTYYNNLLSEINSFGLGKIKSMVGYYNNRIKRAGSHLIDLMRYYCGEVKGVIGLPYNMSDMDTILNQPDPTVGGILFFENNIFGHIIPTCSINNNSFEITVNCDSGQINILNNGVNKTIYRFENSESFSGYRDLKLIKNDIRIKKNSTFVSAVENIISSIENGTELKCNYNDGYKALKIAENMIESAGNNSRKILC